MKETARYQFVNPEVASAVIPRLSSIAPKGAERPFVRTVKIKNAVYETAEELGMHPRVVLKELRLARAQTKEEALGIEQERVSKYAYVGDIHGFTDQKQAEIEEQLLAGNFEQVFFMGDIGGSALLARLQKLFYQGGNSGSDNLMWNRYKTLAEEATKEGREVDDQTILSQLREGYVKIASFERVLADSTLSEDEARRQVSELSDEDVVAGIRWTVKHKHFGHYVSDLPEAAIESLAFEVRENYERFGRFAKQIKYETGAQVIALEGNWDARLPFDFERDTEVPVALPIKDRRFYGADLLRDMGVNFVTTIETVETDNALHILVPFDSLTRPIDQGLLANLIVQVAEASADSKTVTMLAHAVASWEMHGNKTPTGEGKVTAENLMTLVAAVVPEQLVTAHEHFVRKDQNGQLMSPDMKYVINSKDGEVTSVSGDYDVKDLTRMDQSEDFSNIRVIVSPVPMSDQLSDSRIGVAENLKDKASDKNLIRGLGGKASPVRVDRPIGKIK